MDALSLLLRTNTSERARTPVYVYRSCVSGDTATLDKDEMLVRMQTFGRYAEQTR